MVKVSWQEGGLNHNALIIGLSIQKRVITSLKQGLDQEIKIKANFAMINRGKDNYGCMIH
jgi:hypothetical protein